jgi:DNA-binding FadR family transcriptional regulator
MSRLESIDISDAVRETVFAPVGGAGLVEQTVRRLGEAIGMGLLTKGERLPPESELAARLEISPMTLRQALAILRETGYLETTRGRGGGTFVKSSRPFPLPDDAAVPSADELRDLTELRVAICGHAAALAAARASHSQVNQLAELVSAMEGDVSFAGFRQLDSRLHLGIASASRSRRLIEAESAIQRDLSCVLALGGSDPTAASLASSNHQHGRIVAAIEAEDQESARSEMESHVRGLEDILIGLRLGMIS